MAELETVAESRGLILSVVAMAALVIGGWMLYHSVMETVGAVVLAVAFVCMFLVVAIS